MPLDPRIFETGPSVLNDIFNRLNYGFDALRARSLAKQYPYQANPGTYSVLWDTGIGTASFATGVIEADTWVTAPFDPTIARIFLMPHGDSNFKVVTANVVERTSTQFRVHFALLSGVPLTTITLDFEYLIMGLL